MDKPVATIRYAYDLSSVGRAGTVEVLVDGKHVCDLPVGRVVVEQDFAKADLATVTVTLLAETVEVDTLDLNRRTPPAAGVPTGEAV